MKKYASLWAMGMVIGFYITFVLQNLWNWFVVPAFGLPPLSYWAMYGIQLLASLFFQRTHDPNEARWKAIAVALDSCVPEGKRQFVKEEVSAALDEDWVQLGMTIFSLVCGATVTLAIGWGVHSFLA